MTAPNLRRELGLFDLTLLLVIAVVNINTIPVIAAAGWRTITLWILAFVLFLIPQGMAVAEFGKQYPGEGGIYLWTREMFGDFHAFISGWCYWTNNLFYFPSVLFILVGVLVYAGGKTAVDLAASREFMAMSSLAILIFITALHIRGLGIGKWLNNIGAFGTWFGLGMLVIIGITVLTRYGKAATPLSPSAFMLSFKEYTDYSTFSIMLYSIVGLELGSVMGDEIKDVTKIIGKAALMAGTICILLYLVGSAAILIAVPAAEIGAIQGLMQAVALVATDLKMSFMIPIISVLLALAVMGVCSAWIAGAARVPFVMGLDVYLPSVLGNTHPKWGTPYVSLLVQCVLSGIFIFLSLYGASVGQAYRILLSSSVVIQLIPFLYLFLGLWKLGRRRVVAVLGFIASAFGILFVFVPSLTETDVLGFELKVIGSSAVMLGLAIVFYVIGRRKHNKVVQQLKSAV